MTVGEKIQFYRKNLGLSQKELGQKLHVSRQTVSLWEKDQTVPTIDNLALLKEIFNVSFDKILGDDEEVAKKENTNSIDGICAAIAYAMGIEAPKYAAPKNYELGNYIDKVFDGKKADRVVMYNPDAIAQWIYEKYPHFFNDVKANSGIEIPLATVMPSVTPVCFGTMYTGAQPEVHGIQKYEKPIITIDTLFDALARAGKKVALLSMNNYSMSIIFAGRDIDYYIYDQYSKVNAKADVSPAAGGVYLCQ